MKDEKKVARILISIMQIGLLRMQGSQETYVFKRLSDEFKIGTSKVRFGTISTTDTPRV